MVGPGASRGRPGRSSNRTSSSIRKRFGPKHNWTDITEHWLAVEVLSRSSRIYDREFKRDAYFALGVSRCWLVDIEDRSVDVWRARTEHEIVRDVIRWRVPTTDIEATINLNEVFAELE